MAQTTYQTKRDLARTLLRDAIIRGDYRPGDRLILEDLSERYELSLTPVREAMQQLEAEGFVHHVPHRGAIVAPLDRDELLELYAIREGVEALATRYGVPNLRRAAVERMEALASRMDEAMGAWDRFLAFDREFHLVVYEASGSALWPKTIQTLWHRAERYMLAGTRIRGAVARIQADHREILAACGAGDVAAAESGVRAHLARSLDRLLGDWTGRRR